MKFVLQNIVLATLISLFMTAFAVAKENLPDYTISISIEPESGRVMGTATLTLTGTDETEVSMGHLKAFSMVFNGVPFEPQSIEGRFQVPSNGTLEIQYEGVFTQNRPENVRKYSNDLPDNLVSADGIFLNHGWYPVIEGLAHYSLKAVVPPEYSVISEADDIVERETEQGREYSFLFPYPLDGVHLAAGRYSVIQDSMDGIGVFGYFFKEDIRFAETYINSAKKYITMYEELIGPYPFKRFSIVENILPTGYAMPTYTLLGRDVVRLPFIVDTSLGHEVLHQWFGNFVFADYKQGNWVEGLTTYLSDHLFKQQEQKGRLYRKNILINYQSHVTPARQIPLKSFIQRADFATKAIGYGKGAMIFHMLKGIVGDTFFFDALRMLIKEKQWDRASWADIRVAFEKTSGKSLDWFFRQWLDRSDIPCIEIQDPRVLYNAGIQTVSFTLAQSLEPSAQPYRFDIQVMIVTEEEQLTRTLHITKDVETFEIPVENTPTEIIFDPNYDLMRALQPEEYPPVVSRLIGEEKGIVVVARDDEKIYSRLINDFQSRGFTIQSEENLTDRDISSASLLLLGEQSSVYRRLFGVRGGAHSMNVLNDNKTQVGFTLSVKNNPLNPSKVVALACGTTNDEVSDAARKIIHYGRYSKIGFREGQNIEKDTVATTRGIRKNLRYRVRGLRPSKAIDLVDIINDIIDKPIIYVGESHTSYEDHRLQLEVIRRLHATGRKFAVGMEMFQRQFQNGLDAYISGEIDEREFLKSTEYFERWRFDYQLYKDIIDFAKANNLPVLALNIDSAITQKVAREGLDALSEEEKKQIPPDMDMSDKHYLQRLREVFEKKEHQIFQDADLYDFYQAQILWDETMAHTIAAFLAKAPEYQMVVLAGSQHLAHGSGIPQRVRRLNGKDYSILINANLDVLEDTVADYVLFTPPLHILPTPRLGILVTNTPAGLQIDGFSHESIARKSGLKKGDLLIAINDLLIEVVEDVKFSLLGRKSGDVLQAKVLRKKFLLGKKEMVFRITLP